MLNRKTQNLPAVKGSEALALVAESGSAMVAAGQIPKSVQRGVMEVMLAFPAQGMADADRRVVRDLYLEAVEGFPRAVVEWTLKFLVFNNPRNTATFSCAPTPQDVRDACKVTHGCWTRWIIDYYFEGVWAKPSTNQMLTKDNDHIMQRYYAAQRGGKPGEPRCIVPEDLQIEYLRREIERQLPDVENEEQRTAQQYVDAVLLTIRDEVLDRMPEAAFPDGALELVRAKRTARAERARKAAELQDYIDSLPSDVRHIRRSVVKSEQWAGRDETDIMVETNRRLEIINAARAEAEAEGNEFLGATFDDGSEWHEREFKRYYR
jgi:hypothetical protein